MLLPGSPMNRLQKQHLVTKSYFFRFGVPIGLHSPQRESDFTVDRGTRTDIRKTDRDRQG